ncbi:MAG TPA: GNAT family N-acetyltransferase [Gemmatimonadales bacterium]|nr:GNAT family N-acetyltransferase [Gemmatimonadales bacterium]
MKLWQPEPAVRGPEPVTEGDLGALNRLFSDAFTDRYRRDGLVGVRVPQLSIQVWRYALRDAQDGAMLWRDENEEIVAFNIAHRSGAEGWMGPLAVRPDRQGLGLGRVVVQTALAWLEAKHVETIGLETMPRTVENIGFYSRLGFLPSSLTITLTGDARARGGRIRLARLGDMADADRRSAVDACRAALAGAGLVSDYARELELTLALALGDAVILLPEGPAAGFALFHSAPLAEGRAGDELRVLKLFARGPQEFERLVSALEASAHRLRVRRVTIRCQTSYPGAYQALVRRGYRVRWTDLRMYLQGHPERAPADDGVLFSNWEI